MSEKRRGIVIVGLGRIARAHLEALEGRADLPVVAVVEPYAPAAAVAEERGLPVFADVAALLASMTPRAALVCTPNDSHARIAGRLLAAGIHVLVEKPLAKRAAEAKRSSPRPAPPGWSCRPPASSA